MDENVCPICNREISQHSKEEWAECLEIEDKATLNKIRKHYAGNDSKKN